MNTIRYSTARLCLVIVFLLGAALGVQAASSNVMVVANDPRDMTFTNLENLMTDTQNRLLKDKVINDRDVVSFFEVLRNHGAPNAGSSNNQVYVSLVVPAGDSANQGIVVVRGNFDRKAVLDLISRRYAEHVNEHINDSRQKDLGIGAKCAPVMGFPTYHFVLPLRDRELTIVDVGPNVIFASHKKGDVALLKKTIEVLSGKLALNNSANRAVRVKFSFTPNEQEKEQLLAQIDDAYGRYKDGQMVNRRGVRRFTEKVKGLVSDQKVGAFKGYISDLQNALLVIDRNFTGSIDSKNLAMTLSFGREESAQAVKAALVKHLVAEIKKPANQTNAVALQNPKVLCQGTFVFIQVPLETEQDQMHAFAIMASMVARNILATTQPTVVKRLKFLADHQASIGRDFETTVQAEIGRTSFFSIIRKTSLMYTAMKARTNIRRAENVYVDLTKDPKTFNANVQKLVDITTRNIDEVNKYAESVQRSMSGSKNNTQAAQTFVALQAMKLEMTTSARSLIMTVRSPGFKSLAGSEDKKLTENINSLAKKVGDTFAAGAPILQSAGSGVAGAPALNAQALNQGNAALMGKVDVPVGMTLQRALQEYQVALKKYTQAIASNDSTAVREAYDQYLSKYMIYQALKESAKK